MQAKSFSRCVPVKMAGKGKRGSVFVGMFEEAKRQKVEDDKAQEATKKGEEKDKSADERFQEVLAAASPHDIYGEYIFFLKKLPRLIKLAEEDLIGKVRSNLKIDDVQKQLSKPSGGERVNLKGDQYPLLDALSFKLGLCLRNILAPPTQTCLLCKQGLLRNHKPTVVPFHTLAGPEMASKFSWECRACSFIFDFRGKYETNNRVYYSLDQYGNPDVGFKKYPTSFEVSAFRI